MKAEDIIKAPIVTEKSSEDITLGKYTFKVDKRANKVQIAKAVEELFNVKVLKVNTMNYKGKYVNYRGIKGKRSDFKKAIVTIDLDPKETKYKVKDGKEKKTSRKYNKEIEGFLGV